MKEVLIVNAYKCLICGDVVSSKGVHDFRRCSCGNLFVDGGLECSRIGFIKPNSIESACFYENNEDEEEEE